MVAQMAITLLAVTAFSAFVIDFGILWVARAQAQNAADASAHAGAVALAFDDFTDRATTSPAVRSALAMAQGHGVFGEAPNVDAGSDITFPAVPDPPCTTDPLTTPCIRVDVYRNQVRGNPLPVFFGRFAGITAQGVKATATAAALAANAVTNLRPFAIPDKWFENTNPPWTLSSSYAVFGSGGGQNPPPLSNADVYVAPTTNSTGSGYSVTNIPLTVLQLDNFCTASNKNNVPAQSFLPVDLPRADGTPSTGGKRFEANISSSNGLIVTIGSIVSLDTGVCTATGPLKAGIDALVAQDPSATWDTAAHAVRNSCAPVCAPVSPRIVPVPLYDVDTYVRTSTSTLVITNIVGFFVQGYSPKNPPDVMGYFTAYSGSLVGTAPIGNASSFLRFIELVR